MRRFFYHHPIPLAADRITQRYGENHDHYYNTFNQKYGHNGVDFSATVGTPIHAVDNGHAYELLTDSSGFGIYLKTSHAWGHAIYAHLDRYAEGIAENTPVRAGDVIAYSGNTGASTGPHLHFGIRTTPYDQGNNRQWVNPMPELLALNMQDGSTLAPHWFPHTVHEEDIDRIIRWQPSVLKIFTNIWRNYALLDRLYRELPNTIFVLRDHPTSEQHKEYIEDPIGTGEAHVNFWMDQLYAFPNTVPSYDRDRTLVLGINEPWVWEYREQVMDYQIAFSDGMRKYGQMTGAYNFSVGWPGNEGVEGAPPDWTPYARTEEPLTVGGHHLVMHCYWGNQGVEENATWWANSHIHCPWNMPIIIGEGGVDMGVYNWWNGEKSNRGYKEHMDDARYQGELAYWDQTMLREDRRVVGATTFTFRAENELDWGSFDITSFVDEHINYAISQDEGIPEPPPVEIPPIEPPPVEPPIEPPVEPPVEPELPEPPGIPEIPGFEIESVTVKYRRIKS